MPAPTIARGQIARPRAARLRAVAPWRVTDGFGRAVRTAARYVVPRTREELASFLYRARQEGLPITFRGAGRSYGDASLGTGGLTIDMTGLDRVIAWDAQAGIIDTEPGLTIEGLWRHTLGDGYWPAVVPGTMRPTLGGCLSMNVHGKNNFRAGPMGQHVLDFDLATTDGRLLHCSREENSDLFHATIGGLGLLGAVVRLRLRLHRVPSGLLCVVPLRAGSLGEMFDQFEARLSQADYLVGWIDAFASGDALGRGVIHQANYADADAVPDAQESLRAERQTLPSHVMGLPRAHLWKLMRLGFNDPPGIRFLNAAKHLAAAWGNGRAYLQSHVAFAFLLDYIPNWRLAYGPSGFVQVQVFVPAPAARATFAEILRVCQEREPTPYLAVLKRHRPDAFLLSHGLDGWSLALDLPARDRPVLDRLARVLTSLVLDAGGTFYFAKDGLLLPAEVERAYGPQRLQRFAAIRRSVDPENTLTSDLARRVFGAG